MHPTDRSLDALAPESSARAQRLIRDADLLRTRHERSTRRRFVRLFVDPHALEVTITLTDQVMRFTSVHSAVATLRHAAHRATVAGFGLLNAVGLRAISLASRVAPSTAVKVVHARVRGLSNDLILNADPGPLRRHIEQRRRLQLQLNINVLGEAVLGEAEARDRLERLIEMMRRPEVNYVSVKLSSVASQVITIDFEGSLERVAQKLRILFREAERNATFVNLDMEEYRDLRLTVAAFEMVLSETEFVAAAAGIVLQAYLPDSHGVLDELLSWATDRFRRGGGRIKIRLVKGANLAMEHAEAELHGWTPAPYQSKADVDASYARLLDICLRPDYADAVRIGVASHNLFHLAWALDVARLRGVQDQLDVEMLEGMANAEALAIVKSGQSVLLYVPVTRHDDFAAAVAYLVRRLDENTSEENYLRAAFTIADRPKIFEEQKQRFLASVEQRHRIGVTSLRHSSARPLEGDFANAPDGDPTDPRYVSDVTRALADVRALVDLRVDPFSDRPGTEGDDYEEGGDPSAGGASWYRYRVATNDEVDQAVLIALAAWPAWNARSPAERGEILRRSAEVVQQHRARIIAVMSRDAGKTVSEADSEVSEAIDFVRFYASRGFELEGSTPLGVVLVVPPWNFPYAIPTGGVAAALAAGNAVILKPAREAVATAWELTQRFWEGGVPRDVLQFVPTRDDDTGRHLVTHQGVNGVILTGSFDTARLFTSWRPDLHLMAETSGKNAIVITSCADIDLAVKDLVQSAFGHAGQKCSAASLAIVDQSTYDNPVFIRQLTDAVKSLRVGPSYDFATTVGPIIRPAKEALQRALSQLDAGEAWLVKPEPLDDAGYLWRPGVRIGVRPGSWSHHHEWFGPVLALMPVADLETAISWQNQIGYGLTAGLHSLDEAECQRWISQVQAGNLYVNRGITGAVVNRQPFGGWKRSSVGPTAKAGGANYVNCLRHWAPVYDVDEAVRELRKWWDHTGSRSRDEAGLLVERNYLRYSHALGAIAVRIDASFSATRATYLSRIIALTGATVELSALGGIDGIEGVGTETVDEMVQRCAQFAKVRWLSDEVPPVEAFLDRGLTTDRRPLAQSGAVEGPRWLIEQSVAITNHRYGNVNAGPKPTVRGLAE